MAKSILLLLDEALGYRTFAVRDNVGNFIQFCGN
jgi:hypothetical protein